MDLWSLFRSYDGVLYKPELARRFGGPVAGLVLSQVLYWFMPDERGKPRTRTVVDGQLWLAQTYTEWGDATALSKFQVHSALQGLEAQKVLRLRKALIPYRGWLLCVQPDFGELTIKLAGVITEPGSSSSLPQTGEKIDGGGEVTSLPIRKDCFEIVGETETVASAREVLKAFEAKQSPARLEHLWAMKLREQTGRMQPIATRKKQGLFKRIQTTLGDDAPRRVGIVLDDWAGFCMQVMRDRGMTKTPDVPTLEFLVYHLDVALSFSDHRPAVVNSSSPRTVIVPVVESVVEQPATPEEVAAIFNKSSS